jgi:hypothetical protein
MRHVYLFLLFSLLIINTVNGQSMDQAEMQKRWVEYMTPGEMHQELIKSVGEWNVKMKMWMAPGEEAIESEGTAVNESIMGGRYLQAKHNIMVMGMPMEGLNLIGYDNGKKQFMNFWIDNMGTGMSHSAGTYDPATNTITFNGKMYDPMIGQDMDVREIYRIIDNNHHHMEMFTTHEGGEYKMMELEFRRK